MDAHRLGRSKLFFLLFLFASIYEVLSVRWVSCARELCVAIRRPSYDAVYRHLCFSTVLALVIQMAVAFEREGKKTNLS